MLSRDFFHKASPSYRRKPTLETIRDWVLGRRLIRDIVRDGVITGLNGKGVQDIPLETAFSTGGVARTVHSIKEYLVELELDDVEVGVL